MTTKTPKQLRDEQVERNIYATSYLLVTVLAIFLIILMSSCSSTKAVYQKGQGWMKAERNSTVTGWSYKEK